MTTPTGSVRPALPLQRSTNHERQHCRPVTLAGHRNLWHRLQARLTVKERVDVLYWLVWLAEEGIRAKRREGSQNRQLDATDVASLASWQMDLEAFAKQIGEAKKL